MHGWVPDVDSHNVTEFTALELDAVTELLNIGAGVAAGSLSQMTDDEVLMSIPCVELYAGRDAACALGRSMDAPLTAVVQAFMGDLAGEAVLFFPKAESLELVRAILKCDAPLETMSELEQEALEEIANIVMNACLSMFADVLEIDLSVDLPASRHYDTPQALFVEQASEGRDDIVLLVFIEFSLRRGRVASFLNFALTVRAAGKLRNAVRVYLERKSSTGEKDVSRASSE